MPAAAGALLDLVGGGDVLDVVADLVGAGLVQAGHHDVAAVPRREHLPGLEVDHVHEEGVLEDVQPLLRLALGRDVLHLVEGVGVVGRDAELLLHRAGVPEGQQRLEVQVGARVDAHPLGGVGDVQQVVGGCGDRGGAVHLRHLDLLLGGRHVPGAGGDRGRAQPVPQGVVHDPRSVVRGVGPRVDHRVTGADALHVEGARAEDRADLPVPLGVDRGPGHARRTAAGVEAQRGRRAVREVVALVVTEGRLPVDALPDVVDGVRRHLGQVGRRPDLVRGEPVLGPQPLVEGHLRRALECCLQPPALRLLDPVAAPQPGAGHELVRRLVLVDQLLPVDRLVVVRRACLLPHRSSLSLTGLRWAGTSARGPRSRRRQAGWAGSSP